MIPKTGGKYQLCLVDDRGSIICGPCLDIRINDSVGNQMRRELEIAQLEDHSEGE